MSDTRTSYLQAGRAEELTTRFSATRCSLVNELVRPLWWMVTGTKKLPPKTTATEVHCDTGISTTYPSPNTFKHSQHRLTGPPTASWSRTIVNPAEKCCRGRILRLAPQTRKFEKSGKLHQYTPTRRRNDEAKSGSRNAPTLETRAQRRHPRK